MFSFWDNLEPLQKLVRFVPYIFIMAGFIIAFAGQFVKSRFDERIKYLEQVKEQLPPQINAILDVIDIKTLLLQIQSSTRIPFKLKWLITTERDSVISGILLESAELHPTDSINIWNYNVAYKPDRVINNYIELRFDYESIYAPKYITQKNLKGRIVVKYKMNNGELVFIEQERTSG